MKKVLILISLIILVSGCQNRKNNESLKLQTEDLSIQYEDGLAFFPPQLISHFPSQFNKNSERYDVGYSTEYGYPLYLYLVESLIDSDQKEKIKTNKNNAIALYLAKDTCLLIINRFAKKGYYDTIKLSAEEKIIINKNCYLTKYPVPKFNIYDYDPYNNSLWQFKKGENNTEVSLSDDYTLYVLDAKSGKFVTDSLLSKYEFMPKNWEHGFSRGIAVNKKENIVIYWLNVW